LLYSSRKTEFYGAHKKESSNYQYKVITGEEGGSELNPMFGKKHHLGE